MTEIAQRLEERLRVEDVSADFFRDVRRFVFSSPQNREALADLIRRWPEFEKGFPAKTGPHIIEGFCRWLLGDLEGAEAVLKGTKRHPWGYYWLVRVTFDLRRCDEAINLAEDARERFPAEEPLFFLLLEIWIQTGWEAEAEKEIKGLTKNYGGRTEYHLLVGLLAERRGQRGEAMDAYERAIAIDPECSRALFRLGYLNDLYGDEDKAIECYERCLEIIPVYANAVINLGILYEDRERYHDAARCFRTVLRYYPNHARARMFLEDALASTRMFYDRDREKETSRQNQILRIPVTDFELSVRSRNCLQKMGIQTLGDLVMKSEPELLSYKNFGETSLAEIKEILASKGLRLGQGLEERGPEGEAYIKLLEKRTSRELLDRPIESLAMSIRTRRCMERLGIKKIRDIVSKTEVELMNTKNFGMTSLNEIKQKLTELGLSLRG
ncbi:MAG: tetratricopeptide repeat protein [Planctomycetes bacterium]|nr:tetratricopeptide repeat protein [Planctomycetota bacterium]